MSMKIPASKFSTYARIYAERVDWLCRTCAPLEDMYFVYAQRASLFMLKHLHHVRGTLTVAVNDSNNVQAIARAYFGKLSESDELVFKILDDIFDKFTFGAGGSVEVSDPGFKVYDAVASVIEALKDMCESTDSTHPTVREMQIS